MDIESWFSSTDTKWYYRPWFVIVMLIFILGPLGLPLVYKSPKFNLAWKIGLTLLMILYTWFLIVITAESIHWTIKFVEKIQGEPFAS